jgi:hypothetical protein
MPNRLVHPKVLGLIAACPARVLNSARGWNCTGVAERSGGSTDFLRSEVIDCLSLAFPAFTANLKGVRLEPEAQSRAAGGITHQWPVIGGLSQASIDCLSGLGGSGGLRG